MKKRGMGARRDTHAREEGENPNLRTPTPEDDDVSQLPRRDGDRQARGDDANGEERDDDDDRDAGSRGPRPRLFQGGCVR